MRNLKNWNEYEVALLVQAYLKIQLGQDNYDNASKRLSNVLRRRAQLEGNEIDNSFRNETGIYMKLRNIEYLYTNGKSGLSGFSQQDKRVVDLQKNDSKLFSELLEKAIKKYPQGDVELENSRESFVNNTSTEAVTYNSSIYQLNIADKYLRLLKKEKIETIKDLIKWYYFNKKKGNKNGDSEKAVVKALRVFHDKVLKIPFYTLLGIDSEQFANEKIREKQFSVRTTNFLLNNDIDTVERLLNISFDILSNMRNCGVLSISEIETYFVSKLAVSENESLKVKTIIPSSIIKNKELLLEGKFAEARELFSAQSELSLIDKYEQAFNDLGFDVDIKDEYQISYLYAMVDAILQSLKKSERLEKIISDNNIPETLLKSSASSFITMYSSKASEHALPNDIFSKNDTIEEILSKNIEKYTTLEHFINWCSMDVYQEFENFFEHVIKDDRTRQVLRGRAKGKTLQNMGEEIGVTRERIRQIEAKAIKKFGFWNSNKRLLCLICALRNNDTVLTPVELSEYFKDNTELALYLYRNIDSDNYQYDKDLDVFIVGDETLTDRCNKFVDQLPETFKESQLPVHIEKAESLGITEEILLKAINAEYKHTNCIYHRSRLSLTEMYSTIFNEYYQKGMHIYDTDEIHGFREKVKREYGNVSLPENDRAISARIADIGILCGRGIYKPKQKMYISKALENRIRDYMKNSELSIFPTNMLFSMFEEELQEFNIDNHYYLQGVLRELLGTDYIFRRDYISKDGAADSFYVDIINYIKSSDYPIDKETIKRRYPGLTEIVIQFAVSDKKILNFFGKYLHVSKLRIGNPELEYLESVINIFLSKNDMVHCFDVFNYVEQNRYSLLSSAGIYNQYSLFSVLDYFFSNKYEFKRPFIGKEGAVIERPAEQLQELILGSDEILISDIKSFAKENRLQIPAILDYLEGFNDTHILKDKKTLISIEAAGVNEEIAAIVENSIYEELRGTIAISQLHSFFQFPEINVKWTDWIVYSIIKKWSNKLEVKASDIFFSNAVPLIARTGEMDTYNSNTIDKNAVIGVIDDLSDIDNLIIDEIEEEFEGLI